MNISEIDEDFVELIEYLNSKGLNPWSSCDGVLAHHEDKESVTKAYISFLKSNKSIDIMAAFLRDKSNFSVAMSGCTYSHPYELYGNMISGNTYQVSFSNLQGEKTEYFERILRGVAEEKIVVSDEEKEGLIKLDECLAKTDDSELYFMVELNGEYQPFLNKSGRANRLTIGTKEGVGHERNMHELAEIISRELGITFIKADSDKNIENVDEFVVPQVDKCSLEYYFKDEDLPKVLRIIELAQNREQGLEVLEIREPDYDDYSVE